MKDGWMGNGMEWKNAVDMEVDGHGMKWKEWKEGKNGNGVQPK